MIQLYFDRIPKELQAGSNHVNWRYEGSPATKVLKIAGTLRNASSTNPETWRSLEECAAAMKRYPSCYAGIGRVIAKDDPYVGVDLDDVRDPDTGRLTDRASEIIGTLDSYAEVSPSETGVKLWVRATLDRAYKKPGVEVYPHSRYFTLTGWMLPQSLPTVEERQDELEALIQEEFPEPKKKPQPQRSYEGQVEDRIALVEFLHAGEVEVLVEVPDGTAERVLRVVCPWVGEHTSGDRSGTRVGQYSDGALWFRCEHAHCAHREWPEFRERVAPTPTLGRQSKVYARREEVVTLG